MICTIHFVNCAEKRVSIIIMWLFSKKGVSGFSGSSTAEEVTHGIDATSLTAIVTGLSSITLSYRFFHFFFIFQACPFAAEICLVRIYLFIFCVILHKILATGYDKLLYGCNGMVTGASSGIGVETTRVLALCGVHVIMAVRNKVPANDIKEAILKEIPLAKIDVMELDLSSLESVKNFASEFDSSGLPLNILM